MKITTATLALSALGTIVPSSAYVHKTQLIYQYPKVYTWNENLAVRSNGQIILTSIGLPLGVHIIDPFSAQPQPVLLHKFHGLNSSSGITEAEPDIFYLAALSGSIKTLKARPGSNNIFRLSFDSAGHGTVDHVSHVKDAALLNGLLALNSTTLLAADSDLGVVWSIDVMSGAYRVAINDTYFAPPSQFPFTVNGLKFRGDDRTRLWFTNTARSAFGYVPIAADGSATGPPVQLTNSTKYGGSYDDFVFDSLGENAYAAVGGGNSIEKITLSTEQTVIRTSIFAGNLNSTKIAEPSAVAFGRTAKDRDVLYVTTGGASGIPVIHNGSACSVGAQLVAIHL